MVDELLNLRNALALRADYYEAMAQCESAQKKYNAAIAKAEAAAAEMEALFDSEVAPIVADFGGRDSRDLMWEETLNLPVLRTIDGGAAEGNFDT